MKSAGLVLIVIGILSLVYQTITYTQTKQDVQLGPIEIQHQDTQRLPIPPVIGGFCIVGGVLAVAYGARANT